MDDDLDDASSAFGASGGVSGADIDEIEVLPHWRDAADAFVASRHEPGALIHHEWFYEHLRIAKPTPEMPHAIAKQSELAYLGDMIALRAYLLSEHKIALHVRPGVGYEVIDPHEQVDYGVKRAHEQANRVLAKGLALVVHTRIEALDSGERKARMDALAHLSALKQLAARSRHRELPANTSDNDEGTE